MYDLPTVNSTVILDIIPIISKRDKNGTLVDHIKGLRKLSLIYLKLVFQFLKIVIY
jgi:hypothetical protein